MKITIEIDTDIKRIEVKSDGAKSAAEYILNDMPRDLGRYYGLLLSKLNVDNKEKVIKTVPIEFSVYALDAFMEDK